MSHTNITRSTFTVITPVYCVKRLLHISTADTTIAAAMAVEAIAPLARLRGKPVFWITSTYEHLLRGGRCPLDPNKDILRFHPVYWPAMLVSAGLSVLGHDFGHGCLTKDGQKMGKSLGNTLDPLELVDQYGKHPISYYCLKNIQFGKKDGNCNETHFTDIVNADLANGLGNLLNQTLGMAHNKYCKDTLPNFKSKDISADRPLLEIVIKLGERVGKVYGAMAFSQAGRNILNLIRASKKFLTEQVPWSLYKEGKQQAVAEVLYVV